MSIATLNFTDRASYLAWRAEWRADYKAHSENIRTRKLELKTKARAGGDTSLQQSQLHRLSQEATAKLKLRAKAKAISGEQRAAAIAEAKKEAA